MKAPAMRFVPTILKFRAKRLDGGFRDLPQTTPVPLRGTSPPALRRGAQKISDLECGGFRLGFPLRSRGRDLRLQDFQPFGT
jgi:hypothetical protein